MQTNNVPVNLKEYKSWLFLIIFQTWQWPTRKLRLLWLLCTSSLDFPFTNTWIVHFYKKIIYSVCVGLIHLNRANKVEVEVVDYMNSFWVACILSQFLCCMRKGTTTEIGEDRTQAFVFGTFQFLSATPSLLALLKCEMLRFNGLSTALKKLSQGSRLWSLLWRKKLNPPFKNPSGETVVSFASAWAGVTEYSHCVWATGKEIRETD